MSIFKFESKKEESTAEKTPDTINVRIEDISLGVIWKLLFFNLLIGLIVYMVLSFIFNVFI